VYDTGQAELPLQETAMRALAARIDEADVRQLAELVATP
jgi:hypothetical protein